MIKDVSLRFLLDLLRPLFRSEPGPPTKQTSLSPVLPQRPINDDRDAWRDYWRVRGQPWRTEPEISAERQKYLAERQSITPDIEQGIYPFKDIKLSRADVEWLLATHENGKGPIDWSDESQKERQGLDMRGVDLSYVDLSRLPLSRMRGGLPEALRTNTTLEQRDAASVHLVKANLREAHLEMVVLGRAHLEGADLRGAFLENAYLRVAHLEGADLSRAYLEGADLSRTHLESAYLRGAHLEGAKLTEAHLEGASLRETYLGGKRIQVGSDKRSVVLKPADMRGAYFDNATNLEGTRLGDEKHGFISLADARWDSINLAVVDWTQVNMLGDEYQARQLKKVSENERNKDEVLQLYQTAVRANRQLYASKLIMRQV